MKNLKFFIIMIFFFLGCKKQNDTVRVRMEVYYNVFDSSVEEQIKLCRAMIKIPFDNVPTLIKSDSILISFYNNDNTLIFKNIKDISSLVGEKEYIVKGEIIGRTNKTNEAYISFSFFPIKVTDEQYEKTKYEKGVTKYISVYFKIKDNSKLEYDNFKFIEKAKNKPVMFK